MFVIISIWDVVLAKEISYCLAFLCWGLKQLLFDKNVHIKGIFEDGQETKLLQYADDMTAVVSDITSAQELFNLLDCLRISSGLSINWSKTAGMWIGSPRSHKTKPLGINWPNEPIKALGIFDTYNLKLLHEKNFLDNLDNIKKVFNNWYSRGLSLYGLW